MAGRAGWGGNGRNGPEMGAQGRAWSGRARGAGQGRDKAWAGEGKKQAEVGVELERRAGEGGKGWGARERTKRAGEGVG
jgi:hypothetical protein